MTMANNGNSVASKVGVFDLESVRKSLIRQEDTIVFSLIERARFPMNLPMYDQSLKLVPGFQGSLVEFIVKETEAVQAKAGRFDSPEENAFFPDSLPKLAYNGNNSQVLHPAGSSININKDIWNMYFNKLLPLFVVPGDDGNYAATAASDLSCLQALSRRIHYGKFVAEVKFLESPEEYEPPIRAQDRDGLMDLLTFKAVEEAVKKRVEKKAMVFGQEVRISDKSEESRNYKVDPSILPRLFDEWVMPLTKLVEVDYLLRRLD